MNLQDNQRIYSILRRGFFPGEKSLLSDVGIYLRSNDITPKQFNYTKLKPMFDDLSEICELESYQKDPGAPLIWSVTLKDRPDLLVPLEKNSDNIRICLGDSDDPKDMVIFFGSDKDSEDQKNASEKEGTRKASSPQESSGTIRKEFETEADPLSSEEARPTAGHRKSPAEILAETGRLVISTDSRQQKTYSGSQIPEERKDDELPFNLDSLDLSEEWGDEPYRDELPESFDLDHFFFSETVQSFFNRDATGSFKAPLNSSLFKSIQADYEKAKNEGDIFYNSKAGIYQIPLSLTSIEGHPMMMKVCESTVSYGKPWIVKYAGSIRPNRENASSEKPYEALFKFAYLGRVSEFLRQLAQHVEPERWSFQEEGEDYGILLQYIQYTFFRLKQQDKVYIAEDKSFAAFNTGLQSSSLGDDVFAFFVANNLEGSHPWKFECFCSNDSGDVNERHCYKQMVNEFREPLPATYFSEFSDLFFNPEWIVRPSADHIFKSNCARLPFEFLRKECYWNPKANDLLNQITQCEDNDLRQDLFHQLGDVITESNDLFCVLNERLSGALDRALKRVRRNYKWAVPCFFPYRNAMGMMLPLSFSPSAPPSVVLLCERTKSNEYIGHTILTLPMAYINARLISRPGNDWLTLDQVSAQDAFSSSDLDDEDNGNG